LLILYLPPSRWSISFVPSKFNYHYLTMINLRAAL
jgi:hypothetical protein